MTQHDDINDITSLAEQIEGGAGETSGPVEVRRRGDKLTAGLERGDEQGKYDPAAYLDKPGPAIPTLPQTASGGSSRYVIPTGLANLHDRVRDALRRDPAATAGETEASATAWEAFTQAAEAASAQLRRLPLVPAEAAAEREAALAAATGPVALPSIADRVAFAEKAAADSLRAALGLHAEYVRVVGAEAPNRLSNLAAWVPDEGAALVEAVKDLAGRIENLRSGVDALIDAAVEEAAKQPSGGPRMGRAAMPTEASLAALEDIEREVEQLQAVAEQPTAPILQPSRRERELIVAEAAGGTIFTEQYIALAVREEDEGWAHTRLAVGVPKAMREGYRRDGFHRAGQL